MFLFDNCLEKDNDSTPTTRSSASSPLVAICNVGKDCKLALSSVSRLTEPIEFVDRQDSHIHFGIYV